MLRTVVLLLPAAAAFPGKPLSFDRTPGRLPKDVPPKLDRIRIEPDIERAAFSGPVEIEAAVRTPVRTFTLNALDLAIRSATPDRDGKLSELKTENFQTPSFHG
jgi:aminopeptidase N